MRSLKEEKGLGIIDTLIVLVIISILMGLVIPKYQGIAKEAQETALKSGLLNIRMAVRVYKMVNNRYPDDLLQLVNKQYLIEVKEDTFFTQEYLRSLAVDDEGYPLDPFNNRYRYNSVSGYVASTTEDYENW